MGQTEQFVERGYLSALEVFSSSEMDGLREPGTVPCAGSWSRVRTPAPYASGTWPAGGSTTCARAPVLLDLVEGVLGPDFYMWGSQFFAKSPRSSSTVAWHQDGYYWPLEPLHESVTAWLAFEDVDEGNGAMQVIPGSHRSGLLQHRKHVSESVLTLELEDGTFSAGDAVSLDLVAGQASLHHDGIVHGSAGQHVRACRGSGLTIRLFASRSALRPRAGHRSSGLIPCAAKTMGTNPVGEIPGVPFARLSPEMHIRSLDEDGER
jgi:hypothetical protein